MPAIQKRLAHLIAAALLFSAGAYASPDAIEVSTQVFQEKEVIGADGLRRVQRVPAANMVRGSEVIYEVGYSNVGTKPFQVVITNPLPSDLVYQSNAARSVGAQLEFSVDQGQSFGSLSTRRIQEASGQLRAARVSDITHVRWKTNRAIRPGEAGYVSLRALVR